MQGTGPWLFLKYFVQVTKLWESQWKRRPGATDERKKPDWPISAFNFKRAKTSLFCCVVVVLSLITCQRGSTCGYLLACST
jgi:hypothetical protein